MGSNEVLLVIVEEAHCSAQRGNINGMDYSREPVERFITQSNWDIYCLCMSPVGVLSLYSDIQTCIHTHKHRGCTQKAVDIFSFLRGGLALSVFPGSYVKSNNYSHILASNCFLQRKKTRYTARLVST